MSLFSAANANGRLHFNSAPKVHHRSEKPTKGKPLTNAAPKVAQPKKVVSPERTPAGIDAMAIVSHSDGWALMVDDLDEPAWVVAKKARAVESAKTAAQFHACVLQIHTGSGKLQQEHDFTA